MAFNRFTDFMNRVFFEEESTEVTELPEITDEEKAKFEATMSDEKTENVTEMAQKIISESQVESDNDEYPDISVVQSVLDSVGADANHTVIRNVLTNFAKCEPEAVEKDGNNRKIAIQNAIEQIKKQSEALRAEKIADEESLSQAEKQAEASCTEAIAQANIASEQAIEAEKARLAAAIEAEKERSATIIAEIRQSTDAATEEAKQQRSTTLESIAAQRAENEAALQKSANLEAEIERQGQIIINQIDEWLSYLK